MKIMRLAILLAAGAMGYAAQEKTAPNEANFESAVIPVKSLTGDSFKRLVSMLEVFRNSARVSADDRLRIVVVYGPGPTIAQMRKVVAELDKPGSEASVGRNIELEMTFLRCGGGEGQVRGPMTPAMEAVAKQLRAASLCKDVQVWDTMPMQLQEGKQASADTTLPVITPNEQAARPMVQTVVQVESVISKPSGRFVRFDKFNVQLRIPYTAKNFPSSVQYFSTGLVTSGEFKEGQKTVLGKISGSEPDGPVFVVVSFKLSE